MTYSRRYDMHIKWDNNTWKYNVCPGSFSLTWLYRCVTRYRSRVFLLVRRTLLSSPVSKETVERNPPRWSNCRSRGNLRRDYRSNFLRATIPDRSYEQKTQEDPYSSSKTECYQYYLIFKYSLKWFLDFPLLLQCFHLIYGFACLRTRTVVFRPVSNWRNCNWLQNSEKEKREDETLWS